MNKLTLLKNLRELGYPLFEPKRSVDVNKTLAEVVKTRDPRLWEGFPLLLASSLEKKAFDYNNVLNHLRNLQDKKNLQNLMMMSLALYKYLKLKLTYVDWLYHSNYFTKRNFNRFLNCFKEKKNFPTYEKRLSPFRVLNTFRNYFAHAELNFREYVNAKDEFDLEYGMSQVFSGRQKELFLKKLKGEKMTKTEREYFSRSVKKKVQALANADLHKLATKLVQK